jgi:hypothetical protein
MTDETIDQEHQHAGEGTAAEKILATLRMLSSPDEDAGELQLMLATVCMGLERNITEALHAQQETGELDEFVLALTRFLATHRSSSARQLLVVEMPRHPNIPAGTRLHLLDEAAEAAASATSPL